MKTWSVGVVVLAVACGPESDTTVYDGDWSGTAQEGPDDGDATTSHDTADPSGSTSSGGTTSTSVGDTTGAVTPSCACEPTRRSDCGFEITCELPMPCAPLTVTCPRPGADLYDCTRELVFDAEATTCVLEALRDDLPAHLRIDGTMDWGLNSDQERRELVVLGDRTLVTTSCMSTDAGPQGSGGLATSAAAEYWTGCLALELPRDRYDCIWGGVEPTGSLPACP